jgi:hypothetical protein
MSTQEDLDRLRALSKLGLLSMAQVDTLFELFDSELAAAHNEVSILSSLILRAAEDASLLVFAAPIASDGIRTVDFHAIRALLKTKRQES